MPKVRGRQAFSQLSDFERGRIIGLHEASLPIREIAYDASTVLRIWTAWQDVEVVADNSYRHRISVHIRTDQYGVFVLLLPIRQPDFIGVELGKTGPTNGIG
ncbi:hypothetical protein BDFB_004918 [Asbolus verrucosus]|uniref:Uncharacterized protein n=1 Tax=Asbolus verrucosus TaxID=1661398 RepID=A0A482VV36_ASBVE|nr:hypothetical protein BDFB_004918 [Asbolus verrucosus]